jgi:hypothetical protein
MSDDLFKTGGGAGILDELGGRNEVMIGRRLGG